MRRSCFILVLKLLAASALNLEYLDPAKLQTVSSAIVQQDAASRIINKFMPQVTVVVDHGLLIDNHKDSFTLKTTPTSGVLQITASSGVAAVWGFNYFLKKYCKSQIAWQDSNILIPSPLPEVYERVIANDRFRYYQNVCTASYSFVWWNVEAWKTHVDWMALNGINIALAPVAQEAAWTRIYREMGMTDDEINEHFTGPAFLSWMRMGNVHGWGGPLPHSWNEQQIQIQYNVIEYMYQLGIVPVFPAFNGHLPKAFKRIFPNSTFYSVDTWNRFSEDYCCGMFLDPQDPLFSDIGTRFLQEITAGFQKSHIYTADPFNEVKIRPWTTNLAVNTAQTIFDTLTKFDPDSVWLLQNWMFVHNPLLWPKYLVKSFLTAVPNGRMLILDLQSEQWPQYYLYEMYFDQPFIWCMLHNFGGTLGMFGNMQTINKDVYEVRSRQNSTMIGVGLTPEGINQNYVVYDLMLESAWRNGSVDLNQWVEDYAERRYGCDKAGRAWRYLLKSVYSFNGLNRMRGKYVITRRPSLRITPWAWYRSHDLIEAWQNMVSIANEPNGGCVTDGFYYDLVDVTRQALQYRAEQTYLAVQNDKTSNTWTFNASITQFLDAMNDLERICATNKNFMGASWLRDALSFANGHGESYLYELNARNQITQWGPNGEISDYACKQWAVMFHYYYIPRWRTFLTSALDARLRNEFFDEKATQNIILSTVEKDFLTVKIEALPSTDPKTLCPFRLLGHCVVEKNRLRQHFAGICRTLTMKVANSKSSYSESYKRATVAAPSKRGQPRGPSVLLNWTWYGHSSFS